MAKSAKPKKVVKQEIKEPDSVVPGEIINGIDEEQAPTVENPPVEEKVAEKPKSEHYQNVRGSDTEWK